MKKFFLYLFIVYSGYAYSCDCSTRTIVEKFANSEFVAKGKIIKNYKNLKGENVYKADIKIDKLFKGNKINSIFVYGRSDNLMGTSCDIFIPENEELIFYGHKDNKGRIIIGMCSGLLYIKNLKDSKILKREINMLNSLSNIPFTTKINPIELYSPEMHKSLEVLSGWDSSKSYGIYKLFFSKKLKLKSVKIVDGFLDNQIDKKILNIIKTVSWETLIDRDSSNLKRKNIYFLDIYHYPKEGESKSFYSTFKL